MATDTKYRSFFGEAPADKVGSIGMITDGTYNVKWVIYGIAGNTYQLFPINNLGSYKMNPAAINTGGYIKSDMYTYIHNTVLPNLKKSGLNIVICDLVSDAIFKDICSKTGKTSTDIAGGEKFWLTDTFSSYGFYNVDGDGTININSATYSIGVRPLITVVKD